MAKKDLEESKKEVNQKEDLKRKATVKLESNIFYLILIFSYR